MDLPLRCSCSVEDHHERHVCCGETMHHMQLYTQGPNGIWYWVCFKCLTNFSSGKVGYDD